MTETVAYEFDAPETLWIRLKNGERRRETPTPPPARRQTRAA